MKKLVLILVTVCFSFSYGFSQLAAFPGAEGFGKYALGAREFAPTSFKGISENLLILKSCLALFCTGT